MNSSSIVLNKCLQVQYILMRTRPLQQVNEGSKLLLHALGWSAAMERKCLCLEKKKHLTMNATQHQILTSANERLQHPDQGPRNGEMSQTLDFFLSFLPPFSPSFSSKSNTKSCKIEMLQIPHIQSNLPKFHPTLPQAIIGSIWCMFLQIFSLHILALLSLLWISPRIGSLFAFLSVACLATCQIPGIMIYGCAHDSVEGLLLIFYSSK